MKSYKLLRDLFRCFKKAGIIYKITSQQYAKKNKSGQYSSTIPAYLIKDKPEFFEELNEKI